MKAVGVEYFLHYAVHTLPISFIKQNWSYSPQGLMHSSVRSNTSLKDVKVLVRYNSRAEKSSSCLKDQRRKGPKLEGIALSLWTLAKLLQMNMVAVGVEYFLHYAVHTLPISFVKQLLVMWSASVFALTLRAEFYLSISWIQFGTIHGQKSRLPSWRITEKRYVSPGEQGFLFGHSQICENF